MIVDFYLDYRNGLVKLALESLIDFLLRVDLKLFDRLGTNASLTYSIFDSLLGERLDRF